MATDTCTQKGMPSPIPAPEGTGCPFKSPEILLDDFVRFCARALESQGVPVGEGVLARLAQDFLKSHPLAHFSFGDCLRMKEEREGRRLSPFTRIAIQPIAGLFPPAGIPPHPGDSSRAPQLSRRVIPGLMCALKAMLGQDRWEDLRESADAIADAHRDPETGEIDWTGIGEDRRALDLSIAVETILIGHFDDFAHRLNWLVAVVDGNLAPARDGRERDWHFLDRHALALLRKFTAPLRAVADSGAASSLPGAERTVFISAFFRQLDARMRARCTN